MTHDEELTQTLFRSMRNRLRDAEDAKDAFMLQADTDKLTGLFNRRGFERRTEHRDWGWFLVADLDNFKPAQDAHPEGHVYGDRILREFADFLIANTRQGELRVSDMLIARTGGDEFTIWCETRAGARRIRGAIREWTSQDGRVRSSAGLGQDQAAADNACYMNKENRRSSANGD